MEASGGWVGWVGGGDAEGSNCVKSLGDIRQPVEQSGNLCHLLKSMMTSPSNLWHLPVATKAKLLYHVATGRIFTSRQVKRCRALSNGFLRQYTTHICMCTICTMKVSPLITSLMFRAWIVLAGAWFGKSPSQSHIVFLRGRKESENA